jgi:hypothetical protein
LPIIILDILRGRSLKITSEASDEILESPNDSEILIVDKIESAEI